jgi:hypothetical protein
LPPRYGIPITDSEGSSEEDEEEEEDAAAAAPVLTRREREEVEKQESDRKYQSLHAAGKTEESREGSFSFPCPTNPIMTVHLSTGSANLYLPRRTNRIVLGLHDSCTDHTQTSDNFAHADMARLKLIREKRAEAKEKREAMAAAKAAKSGR